MKKPVPVLLGVYLVILLYFLFSISLPAHRIILLVIGLIISFIFEWLSTVLVNKIGKAASLMMSPFAVLVFCLTAGLILEGTSDSSILPFAIIIVTVLFDFIFPFFTER